jgi:hypothetical protein
LTEPLPFLAAANRAIAASWESGRWQPPTLDPKRIEDYAARKEGLDRIPGRPWREPFRLLLSELQETACLSPLGRVVANGQFVKLLRARARAARLLASHPEIGREPVRQPLVIMGPMRSGTTRLQRLLACDPRFLHTRLFETLEPVPFGRAPDRRLASSVALMSFLHRMNPALHAIHPSWPRAAEEEFGHLSFSLHGAQFEAQWNVPRFSAWAEERDVSPVYRELRRLLQLNGWAQRAAPNRSWLLKCPQFTADPEGLLHAFPDARMLFLQRDPVAVVGSSASLIWQQRRVHSDHADPHAIGQEWLRKTVLRERRVAAFRATHPEVPQLDLHYEEVSRNWRGAMAKVYDFLGWELSPGLLRRMERYLTSSKAHQGHRYALEQFGLSADAVAEAYAEKLQPPIGTAALAALA